MSNAARDTCSSRGQNFYQFVAVSPVCYLGSGAVPGEMRAFTFEMYTRDEIVGSRRSLTARTFANALNFFKTHGSDRTMRTSCR